VSEQSRWVELYTTSPSGKTLFVCRFCGRISPTPDKVCVTLPVVVAYKLALPCEILEEIELCVHGAVAEVPEEDRKNKIHYTVALLSPTQAEVWWSNERGRPKKSYFTINSDKIEELINLMKTRASAPSELERKHL
jgi:hypothetical protein